MLGLCLIAPPAASPVTLDQAKAQCRLVGIDDYDELLQQLIDTAVQYLDGDEGVLGKALVTQTWALSLDRFPIGRRDNWRRDRGRPCILLPLPPLQSVGSIQYYDVTGALQTLDPTQYLVHLSDGRIEPAPGCFWPYVQHREDAVTIEFTTGYGDQGSDVPAPLRQAILLLVSHLYAHPDAVVGVESRDSSTELPFGVARFLSGRRTPRL